MADNNNSGSFFKPWKDGPIENTTKALGIGMAFLIASGLLGADYSPIYTNPYVWGLQARAIVLNLVGRP
jgi:hypothetical protein